MAALASFTLAAASFRSLSLSCTACTGRHDAAAWLDRILRQKLRKVRIVSQELSRWNEQTRKTFVSNKLAGYQCSVCPGKTPFWQSACWLWPRLIVQHKPV